MFLSSVDDNLSARDVQSHQSEQLLLGFKDVLLGSRLLHGSLQGCIALSQQGLRQAEAGLVIWAPAVLCQRAGRR